MASDIERYRDIAHRASSYAAAEGLTEFGAIQAGARFGYEAGVAAERERAVRIAQEMAGSEPINSSEYSDWADWRAGRRVAAAIREGE